MIHDFAKFHLKTLGGALDLFEGGPQGFRDSPALSYAVFIPPARSTEGHGTKNF